MLRPAVAHSPAARALPSTAHHHRFQDAPPVALHSTKHSEWPDLATSPPISLALVASLVRLPRLLAALPTSTRPPSRRLNPLFGFSQQVPLRRHRHLRTALDADTPSAAQNHPWPSHRARASGRDRGPDLTRTHYSIAIPNNWTPATYNAPAASPSSLRPSPLASGFAFSALTALLDHHSPARPHEYGDRHRISVFCMTPTYRHTKHLLPNPVSSPSSLRQSPFQPQSHYQFPSFQCPQSIVPSVCFLLTPQTTRLTIAGYTNAGTANLGIVVNSPPCPLPTLGIRICDGRAQFKRTYSTHAINASRSTHASLHIFRKCQHLHIFTLTSISHTLAAAEPCSRRDEAINTIWSTQN